MRTDHRRGSKRKKNRYKMVPDERKIQIETEKK